MKQMRFTLLNVAFFLLFACFSQSYAQSPSIYGAYQTCPFHCETIKINSDFTFEYRVNGDLFNDERYKGTWKFVGRNKIRATSPEDHSNLQVIEKISNRANDFLITVVDPRGAIVQGAEISGIANGSTFKIMTNDEGVAYIPQCQQFEITFSGYRGVHKVMNQKADEFFVTLTFKQIASRVIDQTWLIEGNRLYVAAPDGSFDKQFWFDKLSEKKARKIFR
jgi:hypothetical protein